MERGSHNRLYIHNKILDSNKIMRFRFSRQIILYLVNKYRKENNQLYPVENKVAIDYMLNFNELELFLNFKKL